MHEPAHTIAPQGAKRSQHAILFVTPNDADTRAVDMATGRHGFGHVALWSGIFDGGVPIVLDASMAEKRVGFRPLAAMTLGVPYFPLWIDSGLGSQMFHRAMQCIGAPYDYAGLFRRRLRDDAFTCSALIACALPIHIARRCTHPSWRPIAPNDIARGLGVPRWSSP